MFCPTCGSEVSADSAFCPNCSASTAESSSSASPPIVPQDQPYITVPVATPAAQAPVNYSAPPPVVKKKKHIGCLILIIILLLIIGAVATVIGITFFGGPKNLGVKYTQADFNNVIQQLDLQITADIGDGIVFDTKDILAGDDEATGYFNQSGTPNQKVTIKELDYEEYSFEFSDYQRKTIRANSAEATAFVNELAPSFNWFSEIQALIEPDNSVSVSASLNVKKILREIFSEFADKIPDFVPDKLNILLNGPGKFSVNNGTLENPPQSIKVGVFSVPTKYITPQNANSFAQYFAEHLERLGCNIIVEEFYVENGEFVFVGVFPTKVVVKRLVSE